MFAYYCIKLDLLLTLNHDARNHEFKIQLILKPAPFLLFPDYNNAATGINPIAVKKYIYLYTSMIYTSVSQPS